MAGTSDAQALLLQVSADTSKALKALDGLNAKLSGVGAAAGKAGKHAAGELEKGFTGEGFGKALQKVFDSSKLAVVEEGSAKLRIFGSAIEPLGALGIGAAAGIAAMGVALEEAHKAAEFAESLEKAAKLAHVTTDALQEYRFAIKEAGGEEAGADQALQAFSVTLGKAQAGLTKSQRAFLELGFSKAQIKGFTDADGALKAVVERISKLGSNAQKDAVVEQLGLTGLKPLIEDGPERMAELLQEARKLGVVMDADLVKRGAEANRQFEALSKVIDIQLKSAFVDLAPVLIDLLKFVAELATSIADVVDSFKAIENRRTSMLQKQRAEYVGETERIGLRQIATGQPLSGSEKIILDNDNAKVAEIDAELADRAKRNAPPPVTRGGTLVDLSKTHTKTPHDNTAEAGARATQALDTAESGYIAARAALTTNIQEHADLERQAIDAELKKQNDALTAEYDKVAADKTIAKAKKAEILDTIEQAALANVAAADAKRSKLDRDTELKLDDELLAHKHEIAGYYDEIAGIESGLATTAKQRREIDLRQLDAAQRLERETLAQAQAAERAGKSGAELDALIDHQRAATAGLQDRQSAQRDQVVRSTEGPAERFVRENSDPALAAERMQDAGVRAFEALSDGLADAIVNAHSLGDVARNVFRQLLSDILSQQLRSTFASGLGSGGGSSLLGLLKGLGGAPVSFGGESAGVAGLAGLFADGTNFAPGGLSLVGERGPELLNIPRGAQVIPNDILRGLSQPLRGGGGAPSAGSSYAPTLHMHVYPAAGMKPADARRTGSQMAAAAMKTMARARKAGFNG